MGWDLLSFRSYSGHAFDSEDSDVYLRAPSLARTAPTASQRTNHLSVTKARIRELLNKVRDVRVAVVGDCMLDVYLTGNVGRISPEAPVPVVQIRDERSAPGGAANVAAGVVALGASCHLIGVIGDDGAADQFTDVLSQLGVDRDHLVVAADRRTSTKTRVMVRHQHVVRFDRESEADVSDDVADRIIARLAEVADEADALVLEDYNKGVLVPSVIRRAIDAARQRSIPSVADPKFRHFFEYQGVELFKPNSSELAAALGVPQAPRDKDGLLRARARLGCGHLLLTLAEEGMLLFGPDGEPKEIRAMARDVYDVSGAGDTVTGVASTLMAAGATVYEAAVIANYAAGVAVSKAGVVPVRPSEILAAVDAV